MMGRSTALSRVGRLCAGCGLCRAIAGPGKIEMRENGGGYLRPVQVGPLAEEEDRQIAGLCPGLGLAHEPANGHDHPIWGPVIAVRTGHAADESLRYRASSGGALSAVLLYLLKQKVVDRVVQTAADSDTPIANAPVESTTSADVFNAAGSRYAPSAPLSDIRRHLERPGRFAFVGKPCDIAALRAYARQHPWVDEKIPYFISFFCAGIPSLRGARKILQRLGIDENDLTEFNYRGFGWPGYATATTRDGRRSRMSYKESWGDILSKHVQFRCKICPDGTGGLADFVCADAWYGDDDGYPTFEEQDGRSLIITRTAKGEDIIRQAADAGYVRLTDIDFGEVEKMQPSQARRKKLVASRLAALVLLGHPIPRYRGFSLLRAALLAGWWANLRSFLGMTRRVILGHLDVDE